MKCYYFFFYIFISVFYNSAIAEVKPTLTTTYYDINAKNVSSLVKNVKKSGPKYNGKSVWAMLKWDLQVEYSFKSNQAGCRLVVEKVEVIANISLPNWLEREEEKRKENHWWVEFSSFINKHEIKHYENVLQQATVLEKVISNNELFESCHFARLNYLDQKTKTIDKIRIKDTEIDIEAVKLYSSNNALFEPLRSITGGLVIESGFMKSFIGI
ncbi:MAG: DUF922 domain-containing protein [Colwelliaceae bacterium]|nr:DUF922 domain-containing protein [Colwelliaceae bacterium]